MRFLTMERLGMARDCSRSLAHWGDVDAFKAADCVRSHVLGVGCTLPLVWMGEGLVAPVVTWDEPALQARLQQRQWPVLYRTVLADRVATGRDGEIPSPLRMEAFITVQPLRRVKSVLARLSGSARVIAAVPVPPEPDPWESMECDYYGFTVATVRDDLRVQVVVDGMPAGKSQHLPVGHHRRLRQEQLFDVALRGGSIPG